MQRVGVLEIVVTLRFPVLSPKSRLSAGEAGSKKCQKVSKSGRKVVKIGCFRGQKWSKCGQNVVKSVISGIPAVKMSKSIGEFTWVRQKCLGSRKVSESVISGIPKNPSGVSPLISPEPQEMTLSGIPGNDTFRDPRSKVNGPR